MVQADYSSLVSSYKSLATSIGNVSQDQASRIVGSVIDQVKSALGAMVVAVWVRRSGQDEIDILQVYCDRGDAQGNPNPPQSIALTERTRGLFAWVAENEQPLWIDDIPDNATKLVNRLNKQHPVEGRYLNIYRKTREFAAVPINYHAGELRGILVIEMDRSKTLNESDIQFMTELSMTTGRLIWKADMFERLSRETNDEIEQFSKVVADRNAKMIHRAARYTRLIDEHLTELEKFHAIASYACSVFIMTKYPEVTKTEDNRKLERVIETVKQEVRAHGLEPRLASDKSFNPILWKNIEIYLLGCSRGIAIVENRYSADLNPNVAMEWGWMRAAGSDVLYLLENDFRPDRADFTGFLSERFDWDFPESGIKTAIRKWLR